MADLTWTLRLKDGISAPAKAASTALHGVERDLKAVSRLGAEVHRVTPHVNGFANALAGVRTRGGAGGFGVSNWAGSPAQWRQTTQAIEQSSGELRSMGSTALGLAATATGIGVAFGAVASSIASSFLEMVRFREAAVTTLGVLGGGRGRAEVSRIGGAAFSQAQALGQLTPSDTRDVILMQQRVATSGFRGAGAQRAMAAAMDVAAIQSQDASASDRFLTGLSQMMGRSRLTMEDLRQTSQAAGLNTMQVEQAAARLAGISQRQDETEQQFARRVEQAMSRGRLSGAQGVSAVYSELSRTTGRGLGGFAAAQGNTLGGALSNARSALEDMVMSIANLENLPGIEAFKGFLRTLTSSFGESTRTGGRLRGIIVGVANTLGGLFTRFDGRMLDGIFDTLLMIGSALRTVGRWIWPLVRAFGTGAWQGLRTSFVPLMALIRSLARGGGPSSRTVQQLSVGFLGFGRAAGFIAGAIVQLLGLLVGAGAAITNFIGMVFGLVNTLLLLVGNFLAAGISLGGNIIDGIIAGITGGTSRIVESMGRTVRTAIDNAKSILGIHSPSTVFAAIGRQLPAGLAIGIRQGSQDAQGAAAGMLAPQGLGSLRGGAGAPISINVTVYGAGGDAQAVGDSVAARVEEVLVDLFGRAALAGGA